MTKILVVEDETDIADLLKTVLEDNGFSVETASSGFDGLKRLKENGFGLVTLDIFMPGMDGWDFLKEMRNDDYMSRTSVVLFTVLETKDAFDKAAKMGVRLIPKSSGHEALLKIVNEMVS